MTDYLYTIPREVAERHIDEEELENNLTFDPRLVFMEKSPRYLQYCALQRIFVGWLQGIPLPDGFRPPIANGRKREPASLRNVETLLANVFEMKRNGKDTVAVSFDPHSYSNTDIGAGIINLIKLAAHPSCGAFTLKMGFFCRRKPKESRLSRIRPTHKFWAQMQREIGCEDISSSPCDLIILRDLRTKKPIPRKNWPETSMLKESGVLLEVESSLRLFNELLNKHTIDYKSKVDGRRHILAPALYAVYNGDFEHGGRFYAGKGGHQRLTRDERATICFNGQPSVELDFRGLHIAMLYNFEGKELPDNVDPYGIVLKAIGLDARMVFEKCPSIRSDLKVMLLALINGKNRSEKAALNRANRRLFWRWLWEENKLTRKALKRECENRVRQWKGAGLIESCSIPSAEKVLCAYAKAHAPIAKYFNSAIGLKLQNLDAKIARRVLVHMMASKVDGGIPCLPVHDSFITPAHFEHNLRSSMEEAYTTVIREHTGFDRSFKICIA